MGAAGTGTKRHGMLHRCVHLSVHVVAPPAGGTGVVVIANTAGGATAIAVAGGVWRSIDPTFPISCATRPSARTTVLFCAAEAFAGSLPKRSTSHQSQKPRMPPNFSGAPGAATAGAAAAHRAGTTRCARRIGRTGARKEPDVCNPLPVGALRQRILPTATQRAQIMRDGVSLPQVQIWELKTSV